MARSSFCMISIFLLSLVILASASDYGYDNNPEEKEKPLTSKPYYKEQIVKPEEKEKLPYQYDQSSKSEEKENLLDMDIHAKLVYEKPKSEEKEKVVYNKPGYEKPKTEENKKILYNKPIYEQPKPEDKEKLIPSKVDYEKPKSEEKEKLPITYPEYKLPKQDQAKEKLIPSKVDYAKPKSEEKEKLPITYPEYNQPKQDQEKEEFVPTKPVYGEPKYTEGKEKIVPVKPNYEEKKYEVPSTISIQGLVYCKSGLKFFPLPGAVAKVTCVAVDEESYKTTQLSVLSKPCDSKGYFYATISSPQYQWKVKECKAFLNYSPSETCKVPTNINNGISGDLVPSNYKTISHQKDVTRFSVGPFFYTTTPVDQTYNKPPLTNANNGY